VLGQFGWGEMMLLVVVGLFVFGPERLPTIIRDAGRVIRHLRDTARSMRDDLQVELGPEIADLDLNSLNPRSLIEKHLLGEDDDEPDSAATAGATSAASPAATSAPRVPLSKKADLTKRTETAQPAQQSAATSYDDDAT
jgi:sec-independent protein translocase protein TatB